MYCNKYAMDDVDERGRGERRAPNVRSQSMPRQQSRYGDRLLPPQASSMRGGGGGGGGGRGEGGDMRSSPYDENDVDMPPRKGTRKPSRPGKFCCLHPARLFSVALFYQNILYK